MQGHQEYKMAGVVVSGIVPADQVQQNLFFSGNSKTEKLISIIDKLNSKLGKDKIQLASSGIKKDWQKKEAY
jgi:DNA polymerase V